MLADSRYIPVVNYRQAEERFKLGALLVLGCEFIQFSLGGLSRGSATVSHQRRVGECELEHITSLARCLAVI